MLELKIYVEAELKFTTLSYEGPGRLIVYYSFVKYVIYAKIYASVFRDFIVSPDVGDGVALGAYIYAVFYPAYIIYLRPEAQIAIKVVIKSRFYHIARGVGQRLALVFA